MSRSTLASAALAVCVALLCVPTAPARAETPNGIQFSARCLMLSPNEGCDIADVNRDGHPDIIAGMHWYAGPDFVPRPLRDIAEFEDDYLANNGDQAIDVDGDGWIDVISADWMTSPIHWYRNPGEIGLSKGFKWQPHLLKETRGQNEALALRDLDGDGTPEIVVNCWIDQDPLVAWKLVDGTDGNKTIEQIVIGTQGGGHGFAFGDVNGDGREDILCAIGWYEKPDSNVLGQPWKFHPETAAPHSSCPFLVVDLTGDGRNDMIWGHAHDYGLYWREQGEPKPNGVTTWTEHLIDDSWSQAHCLVWADLDGDGQEELITGKRVRGHKGNDPGGKEPACLYYYTWDKAQREFTRHDVCPPGSGPGTGMQLRVADMNADGRPDIVAPGKTGLWLLLNEGR